MDSLILYELMNDVGVAIMTKAELRKKIQESLLKISEEDHQNLSHSIQKNAQHFLQNKKGLWGTFKPLLGEPSLGALENKNSHIQWCYPRVFSKTEMGFLSVKEPAHWLAGPFKGLLEPDPKFHKQVNLEDLVGCFIPALAFSTKGQRLGRGRGYYDRTFVNFKGVKVGLAYSLQVINEPIIWEPHDICMNFIITENEVIEIHRKD